MIRRVFPSEFNAVLDVINDAAQAYKGVIPQDMWREPYITAQELSEEAARGVAFYGWYENGALLAVMGIQPVKDVTLIRHAYVLTSHQRRGLGAKLLSYLLRLAKTRQVLVGTWEAAWWAVRFYEKNGFRLIPKESHLRQYWTIPDRQAETSVILRLDQ
ncbi:MAG: GNAT family N-acetyltransferase [Candidatus Bathyarchaeia archaeon]